MTDSVISQILNKNRTEGTCKTHVSMGNALRGSFLLGRKQQEELWERYCEVIPETKLCIAEVPNKATPIPVIVDVDIKLKEPEGVDLGDNIYNDEHAQALIEIYQSVIRNVVEDCTDDNLICVLLQKPLYRVEKNNVVYVKHGFHLHFPNVFLKANDQKAHIIPRVKDTLDELGTFADIGIEKSSSVIDEQVCGATWLMYGSRKDEDMEPYKATKVFNADGEDIGIEGLRHYCIYNLNEELIKMTKPVEYYLPRILSIRLWSRESHEIKPGIV